MADRLIEGTPVACLRADHPLVDRTRVTVAELRAEPHVLMRTGYVMHRYAQRLFGADMPATTYATDGAEMGKAMVAAGLGISILPDFSITADPLVKAGVLTTRPISTDHTTVTLVMLRRRSDRTPEAVRDLQTALVRRARAYLAGVDLAADLPDDAPLEPPVAAPAASGDRPVVTPIGSRARSR